MKTILGFLLGLTLIALTVPTEAQVQWNYSFDNTNTALATYLGNVQVNMNETVQGNLTVNGSFSPIGGNLVLPNVVQVGTAFPTAGAIQFGTSPSTGFMYFSNSNSVFIGNGDTIYPNPSGSFETIVGDNNGSNITSGFELACYGAAACQFVTTGNSDACFGDNTCGGTDDGSGSTSNSGPITNTTAMGQQAFSHIVSDGATFGLNNAAFGTAAGEYASTVIQSVFVGYDAGQGVSSTPLTGSGNTAVGGIAGQNLQGVAADNSLFGNGAGVSITTASNNSFFGQLAGEHDTTGASNTFVGYHAGLGSGGTPLTGNGNVAIGQQSGVILQGPAAGNALIGQSAGSTITTGSGNDIFGNGVGDGTLTTGSDNIYFGVGTNCTAATANENSHFRLCATSGSTDLLDGIMTSGSLALTDNGTLTVTGITADTGHTDATVCEDTTSHQFYSGTGTAGICLGTSSERYKTGIKDLDVGLDDIMKLKPIMYHPKKGYGNDKREYYGLRAEDVVKVLPTLVPHDEKGKPTSVDYVGLVPVLVAAVQAQQREIDALWAALAAIGSVSGGGLWWHRKKIKELSA